VVKNAGSLKAFSFGFGGGGGSLLKNRIAVRCPDLESTAVGPATMPLVCKLCAPCWRVEAGATNDLPQESSAPHSAKRRHNASKGEPRLPARAIGLDAYRVRREAGEAGNQRISRAAVALTEMLEAEKAT